MLNNSRNHAFGTIDKKIKKLKKFEFKTCRRYICKGFVNCTTHQSDRLILISMCVKHFMALLHTSPCRNKLQTISDERERKFC